ncbi:DUF5641 domain-containing protein [Trichonephila clavipes]|nr:DUF5641 domain-containing protein [Trichonephila clavipes]
MGPQRETSIDKIIGRFKSDGLIENRSGRGRKSILSDAAKRKVLKDNKIDPKQSAVKLAADTSGIMGRSVEGILNSCPLTPLSSDADNFDVLTPGHFFIGRPITSIPEPNLIDVNENCLSRWENITKVVQRTWKKWKSDYLNTLQARSKWITEKMI